MESRQNRLNKLPIDQVYLGQPILAPLMLIKLALWRTGPSEALLNNKSLNVSYVEIINLNELSFGSGRTSARPNTKVKVARKRYEAERHEVFLLSLLYYNLLRGRPRARF